jgi:single-strand DNA-binding protein
MASMNRVILIGRLTADPEHKFTPSGVAVAQFRVAVDRPQSSEARQSGQAKQTDFIPIVAWRQTADYVKNYINKGRLVCVEGRMQVREYQTSDGQRRRETEVIAENVSALDRPREGGEGGGGSYGRSIPDDPGDSGGRPYSGGSGGGYNSRTSAPSSPSAPSGGGFDDDMDDPFADN